MRGLLMKKKGIGLLLCALLLLSLTFALCACGADYYYDHAEKYSVGGVTLEQAVVNLDIDWIDGGVTVVYGEGQSVSLVETSQKTLEQRDLMRWWLDGDTLRIRYAENGHHTYGKLNKQLTVTLPARPLTEIKVSSQSGSIHLDRVTADQVHLTTASGAVDAVCAAAQAEIKAASGKVTYTDSGGGLTGDGMQLRVHTASGAVEVASERSVQAAEIQTASGAVRLTVGGSVDRLTVETASGSIRMKARNISESLDAQSASGSITLSLAAADANLTAFVSSTTGTVTDKLGMGLENGRGVMGDGQANVRLYTASGSITVEPWEE